MRILLTNDDGVYAPGLAALEKVLQRFGEVTVAAPLLEQSGVAQSITFLTPLQVKNILVNDKHWAWAINGSPADCVKLAVSALLPEFPDLVVSGINGGLNAGNNAYYSGTVGGAIEGAYFGITSIAVSLQFSEHDPFDQAAELAANVIEKILKLDPPAGQTSSGRLYNLNIPLEALNKENPEVKIVPLDTTPKWESYAHCTDTFGRSYYWLTGKPDPRQPKNNSNAVTDLSALEQGYVTVTPLKFDNINDSKSLAEMDNWDLTPADGTTSVYTKSDSDGQTRPQIRTTWQ